MTKRMNYTLWTVQSVLAMMFLFAGAMKLALPSAALAAQMPLPVWFVRLIGVAEVAGGLGLVLPGLFRIGQSLTPLAAVCLSVIMAGAVIVSLATGAGALAAMPFAVGLLAVFVARGRSPRLTGIRSQVRIA